MHNKHIVPANPRFLLIRRDNIGDLVCTTPLFSALRKQFPQACIEVLVNSYNAPVLENNPDIDAIHAYTKIKHRSVGTSRSRVYWDRLCLLHRLRQKRIDYAILATPKFQLRALRLARLLNPRHIIGFVEDNMTSTQISLPVSYSSSQPLHETEDVFRLLQPLGISGIPLPQRIVANADCPSFIGRENHRDALVIGIHISARKPSQRWPVENFLLLMEKLTQKYKICFRLFWSPGDEKNPLHPGDDEKAKKLLAMANALPVTPVPTTHLSQLINGLNGCDMVICSDGGAMHVAAGLGKPILCFFGDSDVARWYPWGVPHVLLQPKSLDVKNVRIEEALAGFEHLLATHNALDRKVINEQSASVISIKKENLKDVALGC